jgi:hypothetical protein
MVALVSALATLECDYKKINTLFSSRRVVMDQRAAKHASLIIMRHE